jgi:hypothetical protein
MHRAYTWLLYSSIRMTNYTRTFSANPGIGSTIVGFFRMTPLETRTCLFK